MPGRGIAARDDLAGGGLHGGSGGWSARCAYGASSGCWARRALERARGALRAAIAGGGAAATRRRRWNPDSRRVRRCEGDGVRGGVHARQATPAGAQGWDRDGASRWCMAEPGSAPWAAASTASAVGLRACVRAWFGQVRGVRGGQGIGAPPLGDRVRGLPGHGKAGATRAP
jgi:hypothetical protein